MVQLGKAPPCWEESSPCDLQSRRSSSTLFSTTEISRQDSHKQVIHIIHTCYYHFCL